MALSYDLISQFAKLAVGDKKTKSESTVYGTVVVDGNGNKYVKLDNSDQLTPLAEDNQPTLESTSADANEGERVSVLIKDHKATVTGNISSPAARTGDVADVKDSVSKIQEFDILVGERLQANEAYIKELQTDKADVGDLTAATAKITELEASKASVDELNATKAEITDIKATKLDVDIANIKYATIENLNVVNEEVTNIKGLQAEYQELTTDNFEAVDATIKNLDTKYASIETLEAEQARITKLETDSLTAESATIKNLEADVGNIDTLIFGSASGDVIQSSFANAVIAQLGNAQIKAAMIENVNADQITAGDILTNNVRVMSEDGKLLISDETIQISDDERVRVQIGKDASGDYSISIWDADGNLMFSEGGITDNAIKDAIIRNDMVSEDANISASKLNISSLFSEINNSTETIKSTKIYLDDEKQTLDVAFTSMSSEVGDLSDTVSSQGTELSVIQGKIESKVWQQDIDDATDTLNDQYSILEQTVDNISMTVGSHETILNDAMLNPKIEGNGTPVVKVTNAFENSINFLKLYGKTTQKSFSGKNLLPYPYFDTTKTYNGLTYTDNGNGAITVKGTAEGSSNFYFSKNSITANLVDGETYTFSIAGAEQKGFLSIVNESGTRKWFKTPYTIMWNSVYYENGPSFYVQFENGENVNTVIYPQIELGTTATEYEPYVGGVSSPNPDYPQSLNSIGMDGDTTISIYGANILPDDFWDFNSGKWIQSTDSPYYYVYHLDIPDGTAVTISAPHNTGEFVNLLYVNVGLVTSNSKMWLYHQTAANYNNRTVTVTAENGEGIYIRMYMPGETLTALKDAGLWVNTGVEALPYTPYDSAQVISISTPNGLCGIPIPSNITGDNYVDTNNQHWICDEIDLKRGVYIQRIGEKVFNGSEIWELYNGSLADGSDWYYHSAKISGAVDDSSNYKVICDSYPVVHMANGKTDLGAGMYWARFRVRWGTKLSIDEWKAQLAANPITVKYALATPIETPLDAETLATFASITNEPGDVNVIAETDTEIELSEIASNKDLEGLKTRVSNAETAITQNTEAIELRATRDEVTETLSGYYTIEEADANVQISADSVLTSVSKTYATKNELAETDAKISPKIEGNGTPVVKVTNALDNSIDNLKFYGKTTQVSIPGRNKVDLLSIIGEDYTNTLNGVTVKIENGYAVFSGTHTNTGWSNVLTTAGSYDHILPAGTYTTKNINLQLRSVADKTSLGNFTNTFTIEEDVYVYGFYCAFRGEQTISLSVPLVVAEGTTALTEYEPYVGGVPSPNPDYPQSLDSIGMDGSIDYRVCGKNILDVHSAGVYYNSDSTSSPLNVSAVNNGFRIDAVADVSSTWARYGYYLGTKEELMGKTITVSAKYTTSRSGDTAKPSICLYSIGGATQGYIGNTTKTPQGRLAQIENAPLTYTIDDSCPYDYVAALFLYSYGGAWVTGDWAQWDDIQVEISDTATEYEPYVSSVPYDNAVSIPFENILDVHSAGVYHGIYSASSPSYEATTTENGFRITQLAAKSDVWNRHGFCIGTKQELMGKTISISCKHSTSRSGDTAVPNISIFSYPIAEGYIGTYETSEKVVYDTKLTFTVTEDVDNDYVAVMFYFSKGGAWEVGDWVQYDDIQVKIIDGLHGIPVSSGGTRTDANGQHWVCDEIDLKRGVYIQRVGKYTLTGTESWKISSNTVKNGVRFDCIVSGYQTAAIEDVLSSHCVYSGINKFDTSIGMNMWVAAALDRLYPRIVLPTGSTVETLKTFLQEEKTKGTPVEMLYALNTPIETPLDAETLATFASITNEPGTVIAIAESDIDVELSEIASNRAVETTAANIRETITEQNTSILSTCESIVLSATESVVKTDEFNTYKDTAKAEMELMSDNIGFKFSETSDRIDATNDSLNDEINERNKHILFDQNGITIQAGENSLKLHLDNDMIYFEKNGVEFGFWDGVDFHTGNIIVDLEQRAQFGNFAYIPRKDGSLSFLKVADTAGFYVRLLNGILRMYGTNSTLEDATLNISDVSGTLTETTLILGGV